MSEGTPANTVELATRFLRIISRHRLLLVGVPLLAGTYSAVRSLMSARTYTAEARFMSPGASRSGGAASIAAQLGVNLGGSSNDLSQTPEFYGDILTSRPVLERTAAQKYPAPSEDSSRARTLAELYGGLDAAVDRLRGAIAPTIAPKTGIISFSVRAATPQLAAQIAQQELSALDYFNRQRRASRSAAERRFIEGRLSQADAELRAAEDAVTAFYSRNKGFANSPQLHAEEERLTREAMRRQGIYASLAQAYEQAKIDEVRDTPVITILQEPEVPKIPDSRGTAYRAVVAAIIGFVFSLGVVFVIEWARASNARDPERFAELASAIRGLWRAESSRA